MALGAIIDHFQSKDILLNEGINVMMKTEAARISEPPADMPDAPAVRLQALLKQTTGLFRISFFAGDHFFLRTAEKQLLQSIARSL